MAFLELCCCRADDALDRLLDVLGLFDIVVSSAGAVAAVVAELAVGISIQIENK